MSPLIWLLLLASEPSPRDLLRNHYRSSELTVVLGLDDPALAPRFREAMGRQRLLRSENVRIVDAEQATETDLDRGSVALIGSASASPFFEELIGRLPLRREAVSSSDDFVQLVYPNPRHPTQPLFLFTGGSDAAALEGLEQRRSAELHVRRGGKTVFLGFFDEGWSLDPERSRVFEAPVRSDDPARGLTFYLHGVDDKELPTYARRLEAVRGADRVRLPVPLDVHVYPSLEHKGLITGDTRPAHVEGDVLHAVFDDGWRPELVLAGHPGESPDPLAEGRRYTLAYDDETLAYLDDLASRLLRHRPAADLADPSRFAREALTASLARFARAGTTQDLEAIESSWRRALAGSSPGLKPEPFPEPTRSLFRGVNFTQEGFGIHDGYLSRSSDASLDKLAGLGANTVAIVPYAFMQDPHRPDALVVPERAGSETDQSVIHAIRAAKRRGLTVLLKPQIWIRRSWPGEIAFENEADTAAFFDEYRTWIRHYALMADRYGVEMLAIGTELAGLSGGFLNQWEPLIAELRSLYRGKLVYAANWGREVEEVVFWPLVDFIGVDFYYPLSSEPDASDEELEAGFERTLAAVRSVSERYRKPLFLTEVGYASIPSPWVQPHASDRDAAPAPESQARAYEAAFRAMADEGDWLRGALWWKWPTTLTIGGPEDATFTPNGKPAEAVLERWFGDSAARETNAAQPSR